jgi:hypothetical protein
VAYGLWPMAYHDGADVDTGHLVRVRGRGRVRGRVRGWG